MSNVLLGIAVVLTAGTLMAGTPSTSINLGNLPQVAYTLVADDHGGGKGKSGGAEHVGRSAEAGDDRGVRGEAEPGDDRGGRGEAEPGDDHGGNGELEPGDDRGGIGELEPGDDKGVDFNDLPDDSDVLLIPMAHK